MSDGNTEDLEVRFDLSSVLQYCVHNSNRSVLSMASKFRSELAPQHAKHMNLSNQSVLQLPDQFDNQLGEVSHLLSD